MRRSGRRETQKPIDTLKGSLWAGEEKKGRKLRCPSASKIVLKGISDKYPLAKAPKASLCFPRQVGPMRVQEPRGWCGHFAEGVVPGEDGLQCLGEARPSLGAPHPHVTCCRTPQSRWPPTPATEGASVPVGHTSEPDSTTLLGFRAPRIRRGRGTQVKRTGRAHGELQLPAPPPGSPSSAGRNRCLDAAEACTEDARCQRLRTEYVAQCLGRAAPGGCPRARCRRALRRFFARGPPALTHALLFCPCANAACAERRRQTFVPACAFSGPGPAPSCLAPLDACEHSRICRPRLLAFQASCAPAPSAPDGCLLDEDPRCLRAYAGLVGTAVTPNYVDNASARVAPWCDCGASGNRREECEAFRGLFTRNRCLDGAIQAFDGGWPPILQDQLHVHQDPEHSLVQVSSTDGLLVGSSLLSMLPVLAHQPLL
ncbi:GDNF family receptor alpha-4 isoform X1 [Ailuropoda melanoleuca]|uniref:GDNF family receptor alpha-4 isoform X1 n=1 Tax=Ailuropoda melanoleuca TaxID=9646 RepID=UPI00149452EC|nr:GDNF family receptor alpha-4 isoform X1 [Ailuropoda melanoleuca]